MHGHTVASRRLTACLVSLAVAATTGALVRSQAQGPEIPKGTNALVGRVLDAGTNGPVAGAVVVLTGYFDAAGRPTGPPQSGRAQGASGPRSVITSGDGYFVFRDLPAAPYSIVVNAFGYISGGYPPKVIEVNHSDRPATVQFHVPQYASISGTVRSVNGTSTVSPPSRGLTSSRSPAPKLWTAVMVPSAAPSRASAVSPTRSA